MYSDRTKNIFSAIAAIISAYWWFSHSGGYLLLSKLQIGLIGQYSPLLTFLACLVSLQFVFEKGYHLWKNSGNTEPDAEVTSSSEAEPSLFDDLFKQSQWFYQATGIAVGAAFAAVVLGIPAINSLELETLDLASLESGNRPKSSWLYAENVKLFWDEALVMEQRHSEVYYVPVVSHQWTPNQPVAAFLKVTESEVDDLDYVASFEGMCVMGGIPSDVMHYVDSELDVEVADPYILIDMNGNPETSKLIAIACSAICMLSAIFSVFTFKSSESTDDFFNLENRDVATDVSVSNETEMEPPVDPDADMKRWLAERKIDYKG